MDDLLTTRQVLEYLKVDRITIYRMLNDGRLKGVKVGQQWRFPRQEVERLLNGEAQAESGKIEPSTNFPTHCVQTVQDLYSDVSQLSALILDSQGQPLTEITHPCAFCQLVQRSPQGLAACQATWREVAAAAASGSNGAGTCHAGLNYLYAPVTDEGTTIGAFLSGQFAWAPPDEASVQALSARYHIDSIALRAAAAGVPVIDPPLRARAEGWPAAAARAVQGILQERTKFINRLQQIANLSQIP